MNILIAIAIVTGVTLTAGAFFWAWESIERRVTDRRNIERRMTPQGRK